MSLRNFMTGARNALQKSLSDRAKVRLVIGNESADLDSITSAIIYAYLSSTKVASVSNGKSNAIHIPILNIPRQDISIRPELLAVLPHAGLEPSHLITLDDLPLEGGVNAPSKADAGRKLDPEQASITLVDHNVLDGALARGGFDSSVAGCIDHHADDFGPGREPANSQVIARCGSCTSLIIDQLRPQWDELSLSASSSTVASSQDDSVPGKDDAAMRRTWDAQVAKFALASVLIDTHNLKSEDKTTDKDRDIVDYLESRILIAPGQAKSFDRKKFFKEIKAAKADLDSLSAEQVLRKDYKQWPCADGKQLGISSSVKPLSWLAKKAEAEGHTDSGLGAVVRAFGKERKVDIAAILTSSSESEDGQTRREILVCVLNPQSRGFLEKFQSRGPELSLEQHELDQSADDIKIWRSDRTKSRKQVAPIMRDC